MKKLLYVLLACFLFQPGFTQQKFSKKKIESLKAEAAQLVQDNAKLSQEMA